MQKVILATVPGCGQCRMQALAFEHAGIGYELKDLSLPENASLKEKISQMGYQQAPVVIVPVEGSKEPEHWGGFRPDKTADLVAGRGGSVADPFEVARGVFPQSAPSQHQGLQQAIIDARL